MPDITDTKVVQALNCLNLRISPDVTKEEIEDRWHYLEQWVSSLQIIETEKEKRIKPLKNSYDYLIPLFGKVEEPAEVIIPIPDGPPKKGGKRKSRREEKVKEPIKKSKIFSRLKNGLSKILHAIPKIIDKLKTRLRAKLLTAKPFRVIDFVLFIWLLVITLILLVRK